MHIRKFHEKHTFLAFLSSASTVTEQLALETAIMARHAEVDSFVLDGYCRVCETGTGFLVDRRYGGRELAHGWWPNWRERLECEHCHLNNRQRAILSVIKAAVQQRQVLGKDLRLYAMEQITPVFQWLHSHLPGVECVGSEYLGDDLPGGTIQDGLMPGMRHENVECLSFASDSFDLMLSNDVLEHVNDPTAAIGEIYRVLKPGGELFLSVPFHIHLDVNQCRAKRLDQGDIVYHLPPDYHGNPLSSAGSLVFTDFGWEFVAQLQAAGFQDAGLGYYGSYLYGHLGNPQFYFHATK